MGEEAIERGREAFRPIALRGAVCFDTVQHLREVHPLYQLSFRQFLYIYDTSIAHSDRSVYFKKNSYTLAPTGDNFRFLGLP